MSRKSVYAVAGVVSLAVTLVACSSDEPAEPKTTASPTQAVSPSADKVSREEGATQYMKLVAPFNEALEKCSKVLNPLLDSGESSPSDFPSLREACKGMPEANRSFADGLSKAKWPEEAQESVKLLVDEVQADQLAWQGVSEARSHEDVFDPKYPLTEDGVAAGLVRAHLGLPPVEEIEE
ncbi:hypothetical protein [Streptomyces sp. WG5]|uniref:hypothetical protein n=1 Tax=Streptomyces sp. WG5 TaxID=3417648 RepID=UPI003CF2049F